MYYVFCGAFANTYNSWITKEEEKMNYVYDILLNFTNDVIGFYEWNLSDQIYHVKKIPIFKVKNDLIINIKTKKIKLDKSFLAKICNKFTLFNNVSSKKNCCLLGNENDVLAISIDNNGNIDSTSELLIDEGIEILEMFQSLDFIDINYEIVCNNSMSFMTRTEKENIAFLYDKINNSNEQELKFLYFECFNKKINNIKSIKNKLLTNLNSRAFINAILKFYNLLSLETK